MPSSLRTVLSSALGFSPRLPVSVLVRMRTVVPEKLFSAPPPRTSVTKSTSSWRLALRRTVNPAGPPPPTRTTNRAISLGDASLLWCKPSMRSAGILTCCPSPTPFGLGLGPTNPERIYLPQETLGFRRAGFSPALSLLIPALSLAAAPRLLTVPLRRRQLRSPTTPQAPKGCEIRGFGTVLEPRSFSAPNCSTSGLLRGL